jgi:hypothetical protein
MDRVQNHSDSERQRVLLQEPPVTVVMGHDTQKCVGRSDRETA